MEGEDVKVLYANAENKNTATPAHKRVNTTHEIQTIKSGTPPIAKWENAPVSAVNAIINTLVPTAVFNSYPSTDVSIKSIIIPPPAPTNPHIKPIKTPHIIDWTALFFAEMPCMDSFVVITGFTINFMPSKNVMNTEKLPIVVEGTKLEI